MITQLRKIHPKAKVMPAGMKGGFMTYQIIEKAKKPYFVQYDLSGKRVGTTGKNRLSEEEIAVERLKKRYSSFPKTSAKVEVNHYDPKSKIASIDITMESGDIVNVEYNTADGSVLHEETIEKKKRGTQVFGSDENSFDYKFFEGNALKLYPNAKGVKIASKMNEENEVEVAVVSKLLSGMFSN